MIPHLSLSHMDLSMMIITAAVFVEHYGMSWAMKTTID